MEKTIAVEVLKKHFDAALKADTLYHNRTCLIAQALKDVFPKKMIEVADAYAVVGTGKSQKSYDFPRSVTRLIMKFDSLLSVYTRLLNGSPKNRAAKVRASLPVRFKITERENQWHT